MRQVRYPDLKHDPAWLARLVDTLEAVADGRDCFAVDRTTRARVVAHLCRGETIGIVPADDAAESQAELLDSSKH